MARRFFPALLLTALAADALAVPLRPQDLAKAQAGPVDVKVRRITEVVPTDTVAPAPAVALSGEHRLLVVLVETADVPWPAGFDPSRYKELVFDKSGRSMREFFRENSYGLYDLVGEVVGPVRVEGRMADYAYDRTSPDGARVRRLVERAVQGAAARVRLADFDTHDARGRPASDGVLDHVLLIYAEATGKHDGFSPIWPHRGSLDVEAGGLRVQSYVVMNHAARLGVFVHEFGHDLGLPDLYDRDYSSHGAGDWCLMASGSWTGEAAEPVHISAWGKARLGWITPEVITKPLQNVRIPSSSERPFALKIPVGEIDAREYFLVENRRRVGFDQRVPTEGLVIWHIDEEKGDNDDERHKMVDVVEGAPLQDLDRLDAFHAPDYRVDVFSGRGASVFADDTEPSARAYDGQPSRIRLRVLTPPERVMAVDVDRPEIWNPGGTPFLIAEDGYNFGRFATVPLGKGSEALMQLEATPGGFLAFAVEAFVAGGANERGRFKLRLYQDDAGKPGRLLAEGTLAARTGGEGYGFARGRVGPREGARLAAEKRFWVGATVEEGKLSVALNPFSASKRARFRLKGSDALKDSFNFRDKGLTPVDDYILRVSGFGYLEGSSRPDPLANEADELVVAMRKADALADKGDFEAALALYLELVPRMEEDARRYASWLPVLHNSVGVAAYELKRYDLALERFQVVLRRAQAESDWPNAADVYENLAETSFFAGLAKAAREYTERSRALNQKLARHDRLVENLYWKGRASEVLGDKKGALKLYGEAEKLLPRAFAQEPQEAAAWSKRLALARAGTPEDHPQVGERTTPAEGEKKKQKASYTDLLQFLSEDAAQESR